MILFRELQPEEVEGIIQAYAASIKTGPLRRIVIQRSDVWKSASTFWKLPSIQGRTGNLLCKFSGELDNQEQAADHGGPRREFFTLLRTSMLSQSGLFSTGTYFVTILRVQICISLSVRFVCCNI